MGVKKISTFIKTKRIKVSMEGRIRSNLMGKRVNYSNRKISSFFKKKN